VSSIDFNMLKFNVDFPSDCFDEYEDEKGSGTLENISSKYNFEKPLSNYISYKAPTSLKVIEIKPKDKSEGTIKNISTKISLVQRNSFSKLELELVKTCNCKKVLIVDDLAFNLLAVE
jgi:hypothetical protein